MLQRALGFFCTGNCFSLAWPSPDGGPTMRLHFSSLLLSVVTVWILPNAHIIYLVFCGMVRGPPGGLGDTLVWEDNAGNDHVGRSLLKAPGSRSFFPVHACPSHVHTRFHRYLFIMALVQNCFSWRQFHLSWLCSSGLTQTKQGYVIVVRLCCHLRCLPCFIHCADVPGGDLGGCFGCQKGWGGRGGGEGGRPCSFHWLSLHAVRHTPSGWRPFHTQVWFSRFWRRCFCNRLGFSGQELLALSQPLCLEERWFKFVWPLPFNQVLIFQLAELSGSFRHTRHHAKARHGPCGRAATLR